MKSAWVFLCAICVWYPVQGTTHRSLRCTCNGKALYCVRDSFGLLCANCRDNTEGRHCERCKKGHYHQRAGESCLACSCNPEGSEGQACDSQGQCVCKQGVQGPRCDRCADGSPITASGCEQLQLKNCFCSGHSNKCSPAQGYSEFNIITTFEEGLVGWRAITAPGVSPSQVQVRWSPTQRNVEVMSKDVQPVYLSAPDWYMRNRVLSYGQTLSFSLRLNQEVCFPSPSDVLLEGAGLKVAAPLGNMRMVIPCNKKTTYIFRLDERSSNKWSPQLSALEFQTLLSNLTAIKIRVTFGEEGRGYLDDIVLVSAKLGPGKPANWVENCSCPAGYEGQFCEHCAAGYKRRFPEQGALSQCEPCACHGGSCDPETGDCYAADETSTSQGCGIGYYSDPEFPAGESCLACSCNPEGSEGQACDSQGQCVCKQGVQGPRCDRCADGSPITASGCEQLQLKNCFCSGHSNKCSPAQGYSEFNIITTFEEGLVGWRAVTAPGVSPSQVQVRWSPTQRNVEVMSKDVQPVYLSAPDWYMGNRVLSYGQTLSFSLRLNQGVRFPSPSDVMLEGAGLKVAAPLGNMRMVIPCNKKITYIFRLDERSSNKWSPQLSALEFQTLLSNLTAIKIRVTFGEEGRGYLDDIVLLSAILGPGKPANWVENCSCPAGYEGQFCEHCAAGYKRRFPGQGARSQCEPCGCNGGSCDPETGDCYAADETSTRQGCGIGYYSDPEIPAACKKCPCPPGYLCMLTAGNVKCKCPPGTTGSRCQKCRDGFYGDPLGESGGIQRPCQHCLCNKHLDINAVGNCDRLSGECFKCLNNTTGFHCEKCLEGFFHSKAGDACQACNCNPEGSISSSCSEQGQCQCKKGFEGQKCVQATCPSCFDPVKDQIGKYEKKLQQMEALFNEVEIGDLDINVAMENAIGTAEEMVKNVESEADKLIEAEKSLHAKLVAIGNNQLKDEGKIQDISKVIEKVVFQERQYQREVSDIQKLISDIRQNLLKAKRDIQSVDLPSGDAEPGTNFASDLVEKASDLADKHESEAATVDQTAKSSLLEAEKALALMLTVISAENKVTEQLNGLRNQYETDIAQVDAMNKQAGRLSKSAETESTVALDTLKQIADLEKNLPKAPEKDISSLVATLDALKDSYGGNVSEFLNLHNETGADQKEAAALMNKLKNVQKIQDNLLARANVAKADADKAMKLFSSLGSVDQALEKLKGFEAQINSSKASADDALMKLPAISGIIAKAVANNDKTQGILDQLGEFSDAVDMLNKLNTSLAKVEKMSSSLPSSSDLLNTAGTLKGDLEVLNNQMNSTRNKLTEEKTNAEREHKLAEEVNREAAGAYINANNTRDAVRDALQTVNNLLGVIGKPGSVDEKKVTDLEKALAMSREHVETELKPRLKELEQKEAEQRAAITRMMNDINTILADIKNLEHIYKTIPSGCYNTPPMERA